MTLEKVVSDDAKKAIAEATQLLKSVLEIHEHSRCERRYVKSEKDARCWRSHRSSARRNGKDDNDELRNIAARFNRMDATLQLEQDTRSLETAQLESRAAEEVKDEEAAKKELIIGQQAKYADVL